MVLDIGTLEKEGDTWMVVDVDGSSEDFAFQQDCTTIFIEHGAFWKEAYCGEVIPFQGEIRGEQYAGPAIEFVCGKEKTGLVIPVPEAALGKWYAVLWHDRGVYWALEPGVRIRIPASMDHVGGMIYKKPQGKCVCAILQSQGTVSPRNLGRVAMDLADMPFPKEMWFFDGEDYQESELEIRWDMEDMMMTRNIIGKIEMRTLFWLL